MYYQHYVIFEALHVICKQLKIIYYPKLYRSTLCAYEFLSLKTVWFWYIYTHLHLSLSDTLGSVTLGTCPHTWKKRGRFGKVAGHDWPLPGRHSPRDCYIGFGFCLWKPHREDIALKSPLVPHVPPWSPSLTPLPVSPQSAGTWPLCAEWYGDATELKGRLPLIPALSPWMWCNDITQQADTK